MHIIETLTECDAVVVAMGRRWGKSTLGLAAVSAFACGGGRCAWIVPAYKNGYPLWVMLKSAFAEFKLRDMVRVNETERRIEIAAEHGGGYIGMYSGDDDCDSVRGDAFDLAVLDEAAKLSERAVYDAILPTLADRRGKLVAISTPRGRNWFWREFLRGQDTSQHEVRSFTAPSASNPLRQIQEAASRARGSVSERTYRQEWLAEFVDDAGGVFHGVRSCLGGQLEDAPRDGIRRFTMGVDLAKVADYTVCCVIDPQLRQVVAWERFNQESWPLQKERIARLARHWNNAMVWLDSTGVGSPIYDDLSRVGLKIHPIHFTNISKQEIIEHAVLMVEQQQIRWPASLQILTSELEAYEYERTPAGTIRMNAPSGMHDDCVIAFALALMGVQERADNSVIWNALEALRQPVSGIQGTKIFDKAL